MDLTPPKFSAPGPPKSQQQQQQGFERNRHRSTMPNNPKNRQNQRSNPHVNRINKQVQNCPSPSASCVSTDTTYAQPWKSNKTNYEPSSSSKFRRTSSMTAKKEEEDEAEEKYKSRPMINFVQLRKSIMKPFKGTSKKVKEQIDDIPTTSGVQMGPSNRPMQQEERLKMFRKVGMKQSMKVSAVQRMQKERQRDFQLVNDNNGKRKTEDTTYAQIDSMLVFSSPSLTKKQHQQNDEISLNDDDVEVVIKNSKTGRMATRKEMSNSNKKMNELPMTSTPKSFSNKHVPESLNVSNMSNSSLCVVDDATIRNNEKNNTMYYSTTALESEELNRQPESSNDQYSSIIKHKTPKVKNEIVDSTYETNQQPSHSQCPSVTGESPDIPHFGSFGEMPKQMVEEEPSDGMMKEFWRVSKELKQQNELLQFRRTTHNNILQRMRQLFDAKLKILEEGGNMPPTIEMLTSLWRTCREEEDLRKKMVEFDGYLYQSNLAVQNLEQRKNALLESNPND